MREPGCDDDGPVALDERDHEDAADDAAATTTIADVMREVGTSQEVAGGKRRGALRSIVVG